MQQAETHRRGNAQPASGHGLGIGNGILRGTHSRQCFLRVT